MTEEIKNLELELDSVYKRASELRDLIEKKKLESINLDFEGKYIKYTDNFGITNYCFVDWITEDNIRYGNFKYSYMIRGLGFRGEFTGYQDCTHFTWDYSYDFYIFENNPDKFVEEIKKIEVIDKLEFDTKLQEMIYKVSEYNKRKIEEGN